MIRALLDRLAELTVALSYLKTGFLLRKAWFSELRTDMAGEVVVVTGANSGVGFAAARRLAELGATVVMVCRDAQKAADAAETIREALPEAHLEIELCDLSLVKEVRQLAKRLTRFSDIHALVNNAGVLLPTRSETAEGLESTFATNVLSGFLLTWLLKGRLARASGIVVHMTSGGMYTQKLRVDDLQTRQRDFNGVRVYAQTKRAQVELNRRWQAELADLGVASVCTHPGWADTPGVASALPRFHRLFGSLLRTPEQGADTAIWLANLRPEERPNGLLFFDRRSRRTHVFPWTRIGADDREQLWRECKVLTGVDS
ncbi:MAG: SDR family NAD(P)-dependent oxidoreductase [Myxococcales bacterium]|nr:SDR family NAD(P)-dependent oxidoreductase [Myxococcales bacterium]